MNLGRSLPVIRDLNLEEKGILGLGAMRGVIFLKLEVLEVNRKRCIHAIAVVARRRVRQAWPPDDCA